MSRVVGAILLGVVVGLSPSVSAQKREPKPKKEKPVIYAVVKVGTELRVVPEAEVKTLKKQMAEKHKEAVKAHQEAKKAARKEKRKFEDPAPKKEDVKVLKGGFKSDVKAREFLAEVRRKEDEKAKKGERKGKKDKEKEKDKKKKKDPDDEDPGDEEDDG